MDKLSGDKTDPSPPGGVATLKAVCICMSNFVRHILCLMSMRVCASVCSVLFRAAVNSCNLPHWLLIRVCVPQTHKCAHYRGTRHWNVYNLCEKSTCAGRVVCNWGAVVYNYRHTHIHIHVVPTRLSVCHSTNWPHRFGPSPANRTTAICWRNIHNNWRARKLQKKKKHATPTALVCPPLCVCGCVVHDAAANRNTRLSTIDNNAIRRTINTGVSKGVWMERVTI